MLCWTLYLASLLVVNASHNVTVDDNDPSIIYHPPGSWQKSVPDVLDASGQHRVTSNPNATASFTFTGVAIYFYSPLWTFSVTTQVALDGSPPVLLDLRDYSQPYVDNGPETVQSSVVWSQTGLADTQHALMVSVGAGQTFAIMDALVYTALDAGDVSSSSSTSTSTTSSPSSSSTPISSIASIKSSRRGLAATLGVVCTVFACLVIGGIWWFIRRRRKLSDDYYPRNDVHSPEMSTTTAPAYYSSRSRFRSIPTEVEVARRTRPSSSSFRHTTVTPSTKKKKKTKNPLTTIPEAPLRETSLVRHTTRSPVQDRRLDESLPSPHSANTNTHNHDERGEEETTTWTYPQSINFVSLT